MSEETAENQEPEGSEPQGKAETPRGCITFMWVSGILALVLFLVPAGYVLKFYALDNGPETARASGLDLTVPPFGGDAKAGAKRSKIQSTDIGNVALLVRVLDHDPDPHWRLLAVTFLTGVLARPGINYTHPMECLSAKAALSTAAVSDSDAQVRAAASAALQKVAEHGAVIER